jgi:hypothetical protein
LDEERSAPLRLHLRLPEEALKPRCLKRAVHPPAALLNVSRT